MLDAVVLLQGPGAREIRESVLSFVGVTTYSSVCAGRLRFTYARGFRLLTIQLDAPLDFAPALAILEASAMFDGYNVLAWMPDGKLHPSTGELRAQTFTVSKSDGYDRLLFAHHIMTALDLDTTKIEERIARWGDR